MDGLHLITNIRNNMKNTLMELKDKILLRKRAVIETVNDELKPGLCNRSSITSLTHFKSVALLCLFSHHSGAMLSKPNCLIYGNLKLHHEPYCIIRVKNICQIEHSRHRSFNNFISNLVSRLIAYSFFPKKPAIKYNPIKTTQLAAF